MLPHLLPIAIMIHLNLISRRGPTSLAVSSDTSDLALCGPQTLTLLGLFFSFLFSFDVHPPYIQSNTMLSWYLIRALLVLFPLVVWPCVSLLHQDSLGKRNMVAGDARDARMYVYILPDDLKEHVKLHHSHGEGWARLTTELLMNSTYYEPDPLKADYFWIPGSGGDFRVIEWVIETYPFFNETVKRGEARHVAMALGDYGAGEIERRVVPWSYEPSSLNRSIIYIQQNGLADILTHINVHKDPAHRHCTACFLVGVDIMIPTWPVSVCGPLCGYSLEQLRTVSVWRNGYTLLYNRSYMINDRPLDSSWMEVRRKHLVYFAGRRVPYHPSDEFSHMDGSGRGALYEVYKDDSRFAFSVLENHPRVNNIDFFPHSDFCYSPLGVNRGDTDRYLGGMMFGCIPIMMNSTVLPPFKQTRVNVPNRLPFEEVIDWRSFSTLADEYGIDKLGKQLECLSPIIPQMRRAMSRAWTRLLWTRLFHQHTLLGESGEEDAFETLMQVLSSRVPHGYKPSDETVSRLLHHGWPCRDDAPGENQKWELEALQR